MSDLLMRDGKQLAALAIDMFCVFAQSVFEVTTHLTWEWLMVFLLALTPVTIIEVGKLLRAHFQKARVDVCPGNAS